MTEQQQDPNSDRFLFGEVEKIAPGQPYKYGPRPLTIKPGDTDIAEDSMVEGDQNGSDQSPQHSD
jgi:hypothetical protein